MSLPQTVLETPFGQMLKPQLDQAMRAITQAEVPASNHPFVQAPPNGTSLGRSGSGRPVEDQQETTGIVYKPTTTKQLDDLLARARDRCAVIFFTSATYPPCKLLYPAYDELAASAGSKATLTKVDLSEAHAIRARYQIRATPTFWNFLKGEKEKISCLKSSLQTLHHTKG